MSRALSLTGTWGNIVTVDPKAPFVPAPVKTLVSQDALEALEYGNIM